MALHRLHWASYEGHFETVQELVLAGADTTSTNSEGKTALDLAINKAMTETNTDKKAQYQTVANWLTAYRFSKTIQTTRKS